MTDLLRKYALRGALVGVAVGVPISLAAEAHAAPEPPSLTVQAGGGSGEVYAYTDAFYGPARRVAYEVAIMRGSQVVSRASGRRRANVLRLDVHYYGKSVRRLNRYRVVWRVTWIDKRGKVFRTGRSIGVRARVK